MAFNNFPYTNFQDLNLGWILSTYKSALNKALEALGKATAVEAEVGTYTDSINAATLTANQASATANQAMNIARNANEVLFISADTEDKAVNYVTWSQGGTGYVTAADIYNAIVTDHKVPIFMDRMQYVYEMSGYETDPNSPLTITRFKFVRNGGNRENIVWIDSSGSITYTHVDGGANGFPVVFNYIPQNPELTESGYWDSDKTYAEILAAINSGKSIFLTVKIDGETRELINNAYISKSSSGTYIALGYSRGFDIYDSPYYTNTENLLVYYTINSSEFISVQRVFTVPSSSTQLTGRVLTVNSSGKAEWLPASGGGSVSGAVLYDSQQNLTGVQKMQARENISAQPFYNVYNSSSTSGTVTVYDNSTLQLTNTLTGALTIAFDTDNSELDAHVRCIRFQTGSTSGACMVTLPSGVEVPLGFFALDGIYLLPNTVYELVIINGYLSFNYWG